MNRNFALLIAAVVLLTAGWFMSQDSTSGGADADRNEALIAGLAEDVNQVTGFSMSEAGGEMIADIDRVDDAWVISSSHAYPADISKVRKFLLALKDAQKREERTSKPERYADIGVDDPAGADATGVLLTVKGVAEPNQVILGNFAAGGGEYTYVRVVGEQRSWLANGNLVPERDVSNWLSRDIMDVPSNRIARVEVTDPEGGLLAVDKKDEVAPNYDVEGVPKGGELSSESAGNILASALGSLQMEAVQPRDQAQPVADQTFKIRYLTRDGLVIDATVWEEEELHMAQFAAEVDPDFIQAWSVAEQARQAAAQQPAPTTEAAGEGEAEGEPSEDAETSVAPDLATITAAHKAKLEAEANAINATAANWTFVIPSWKYANMAKRIEDLLVAKE